MDIIEYGSKSENIVLIQMVDGHDDLMIKKELSLIGSSARLITFKVDDWNRDLSPWSAKAVFGKEDFKGKAEETLEKVFAYITDIKGECIIGGYSLAGLFALWAAARTDRFVGVAAASPSVWFPGFTDYLKENEIHARNVYLSLGNKEEKTRNPVMKTVGENIQTIYGMLSEKGMKVTLEYNPGNHFMDADIRTAKAFSWCMKNI